MEHGRQLGLLDKSGKPLSTHIERVLSRLLPRLRREFPAIQDEVTQIEIVEEAGRRVARRETQAGHIERINGYAWVTLRSVATSRMRLGSSRLSQRTLGSEASESVLSIVRAQSGTAEQIEQDILLREILELLSPDEQRVCIWKQAGFSSQEIARHRGSSVTAVDTLFSRAKQKIRNALGVQRSVQADRQAMTEPDSNVSTPSQSTDERGTDNADGELAPASQSVSSRHRR